MKNLLLTLTITLLLSQISQARVCAFRFSKLPNGTSVSAQALPEVKKYIIEKLFNKNIVHLEENDPTVALYEVEVYESGSADFVSTMGHFVIRNTISKKVLTIGTGKSFNWTLNAKGAVRSTVNAINEAARKGIAKINTCAEGY